MPNEDEDKYKIAAPIEIGKSSSLLGGGKGLPSLTTFQQEQVNKNLSFDKKDNMKKDNTPTIEQETAGGKVNVKVVSKEDSDKNLIDEVNSSAVEGKKIASDEQFYKRLKTAIDVTSDPGRKAKLEFRLKRLREKDEKKRQKWERKAEKRGWEGVISPRADSQLKGGDAVKSNEEVTEEVKAMEDDMPVVTDEKFGGDVYQPSVKAQAAVEKLESYDPEKALEEEAIKQSRPKFKLGGNISLSTPTSQAATEQKMSNISGASSLPDAQVNPTGPFSGVTKLSEIGKQTFTPDVSLSGSGETTKSSKPTSTTKSKSSIRSFYYATNKAKC